MPSANCGNWKRILPTTSGNIGMGIDKLHPAAREHEARVESFATWIAWKKARAAPCRWARGQWTTSRSDHRGQAYAARSCSASQGDDSMPPLALTDSQLDTLTRLAEPLHPHGRVAFLEKVAAKLRGFESLGDGLIARVAREMQKEFFRPPNLHGAPRWQWARLSNATHVSHLPLMRDWQMRSHGSLLLPHLRSKLRGAAQIFCDLPPCICSGGPPPPIGGRLLRCDHGKSSWKSGANGIPTRWSRKEPTDDRQADGLIMADEIKLPRNMTRIEIDRELRHLETIDHGRDIARYQALRQALAEKLEEERHLDALRPKD
jgi:hypothetical protein